METKRRYGEKSALSLTGEGHTASPWKLSCFFSSLWFATDGLWGSLQMLTLWWAWGMRFSEGPLEPPHWYQEGAIWPPPHTLLPIQFPPPELHPIQKNPFLFNQVLTSSQQALSPTSAWYMGHILALAHGQNVCCFTASVVTVLSHSFSRWLGRFRNRLHVLPK